MKNILVTGGAGYIGSHTCVALANAGFNPVIIDNFSNSKKWIINQIENIVGRHISCYEGDCDDKTLLTSILEKENEISGVIHFAAFKSVKESVVKPLKYYQNNVNTTISLLDFINTYGITSLVYSSSCTVYGNPDILPVTEDSQIKAAESPYGRTKQICEDIISDVTNVSKLNSISLRYFNPIGAHESAKIGELPLGIPENLVPFITQTAAGLRNELIVFGDDYPTIDGSCVRDYIHVMDLAEAHVSALEHINSFQSSKLNDKINLGIGEGKSVLELINDFEKITGVKLNYRIGNPREGDVIEIFANTKKSKRVLNWEAKRTIAEALKSAWKWQEKYPSYS